MNHILPPGRACVPQSSPILPYQRWRGRLVAVMAVSLGVLCLPAGAVTLGELVKQAAFNNPSAVARQRAVDAAAEGIASARWQFFPTPSMSVERAGVTSSRDISYSGDDTVVTLRLQQTLWSGGRLTAQLEQAGFNHESAEEALREQRFRLAEQVISQYSLWVRSDLATEANQKNLKALEDFLAQSQRREKEGAAALVDVTLVRGRRDQAQTDLLASKASRQSARLQLEQLVGLPLSDEELRADVNRMKVSDDLPALTDNMLRSSPLLKRLRADAKVQEAAIEIRSASYWPEVYARLEHQRGNFSVPHTPNANRAFIGMQMQLGAGLSLGSEVSAAKGRYQAALLAVDAARLELISQIAATYTEYQQAEARSRNLEEVSLSADEVLASYIRLAAGVAFDDSVAAPTSTLVSAVKVVLGGAGLDVLNDRLILDTALALNTDLAASGGKTVGGVTGLSYGYDSASRTLTLTKSGGALWSGSEVQSVLQAIKLGGSSSQDGLRTASFSLVSSTGETGNASTAAILFDTHAPTLDADATVVGLQTSSRKMLTAAKAIAGEGLFAQDIAVWPTNDISSIGIRLDGPQLDLQKDKLVLDVPLSLNANLTTVSGKSIGGVSGLSYGYDGSTHVLTIGKSSGAPMSGLDARAILKAIHYQNATPSAGDRSAAITLTDVAGNSSNTSANWTVDMTAPGSITGALVTSKQVSYKTLAIPDIMGSNTRHNLHSGESADLTSLLPVGMTPATFVSALKGLYAEWGGISITGDANTTWPKYNSVFSFPSGFGLDTIFTMAHQGGSYVKGETFRFTSPADGQLLLNAVDGFYTSNTDVYAFTGRTAGQNYDIGNVRLLYEVTTDNANSRPTVHVSYDGTKASAGDVIGLYEGDKLLGSRTLTASDVGQATATVDVTVAASLGAGNHVITPKFSDPAGNVVTGNDIPVSLTSGTAAPVLSNLRVNGETPDAQPINGSATKYAVITETPLAPATLTGLDQNLTFSGNVGGAGSNDRYLISVSMGGKVIVFGEVNAGDFSLTTPANVLAPGMYHDLTITATNTSAGINNGQTTIVQNQALGWYWVPQKLDSMSGGAGDDQIQLAVTAGGANTVVQTGQGKDTLMLGGFGTTDSSRLVATVSDFTVGQDKVKVFGQTITKDNLNTFATASAYNTSSTKLVVDLDGAGAGTTSYTLYLQNVAYNPSNTHTIFGV